MNDHKNGNYPADEGNIFVCCACGKTSTYRYGFDESGKSTASKGWDESCMLNAQEFPVRLLEWDGTRVISVMEDEP